MKLFYENPINIFFDTDYKRHFGHNISKMISGLLIIANKEMLKMITVVSKQERL